MDRHVCAKNPRRGRTQDADADTRRPGNSKAKQSNTPKKQKHWETLEVP